MSSKSTNPPKTKNSFPAKPSNKMNVLSRTRSCPLFTITSQILSRSTHPGRLPIPLWPTFLIWKRSRLKRVWRLKYSNLLKTFIKNSSLCGSCSKMKKMTLSSKNIYKLWDQNSKTNGKKSTSFQQSTFSNGSTETGTKSRARLVMRTVKWTWTTRKFLRHCWRESERAWRRNGTRK